VLAVASAAATLALCELVARLAVTVRNVGPSFTTFDPVYGKRLKRSFACWRITPEFAMHFATNSYGFRGVEPPAPPEHAIVFLGDSFTMGYGVSDGEEFPALIAQAVDHPVINAG